MNFKFVTLLVLTLFALFYSALSVQSLRMDWR